MVLSAATRVEEEGKPNLFDVTIQRDSECSSISSYQGGGSGGGYGGGYGGQSGYGQGQY